MASNDDPGISAAEAAPRANHAARLAPSDESAVAVAPGEPTVVLFVVLAGGLGGSTRSLTTVLAHLERHVVRVVAAPGRCRLAKFIRERSLADELVEVPRHRPGRRRFLRLVAAWRIWRWVHANRHRLRAIHANGLAELNVVAPASLLARVPIVVWCHAREVSAWDKRLMPVWRRLVPRVRWTAVSGVSREVLMKSGAASGSSIEIVPNPIDPADCEGRPRKRSSATTIGYLGSDQRYKGFQLLPDVIARLSDPSVRWVIFAGEHSADSADTWRRLRSISVGRVLLRGKERDVRRAYEACDVVFVPSLSESFGRVAAEAMLNGIPVVASDLPALRQLIGDGSAGLLFPPGDAAAAAHALGRIVSDPALRAELGREGRRRAHAFYPGGIVKQLEEAYESFS